MLIFLSNHNEQIICLIPLWLWYILSMTFPYGTGSWDRHYIQWISILLLPHYTSTYFTPSVSANIDERKGKKKIEFRRLTVQYSMIWKVELLFIWKNSIETIEIYRMLYWLILNNYQYYKRFWFYINNSK